MNKPDKGIFLITRSSERYVLICMDSVVLIGSLWLSFSLRLQSLYWPVGGMNNPIVYLVLCAPIIAVLVFFSFGAYRSADQHKNFKAPRSIVKAVPVYAALWGLFALLSGINGLPKSVALINFWVSLLAIGVSRTLAHWMLYKVKPSVLTKHEISNSDVGILGTLVTVHHKLYFVFKDTFIQSVILYFGIVFIYKAIPIALSDTGMYSADFLDVILTLLVVFIVSVSTVAIMFHSLNKKWKNNATILSTFAAFTALFYAFINPYEVGQMDSLILPTFSMEKEVGLGAVVLPSFFIVWIFIFKKVKNVAWILLISANFALITQTTVASFNPRKLDILSHDLSKEMTSKKANDFYAFSRESNTIVIMMDMFQGNIFADIILEYGELKSQLTGFTYFPNTLSHGSQTWKSMGAVAGGEKFQVQYMKNIKRYRRSKGDSDHREYSPREEAYLNNMEMAKKYDHSYAIFNPSYVDCGIFDTYPSAICSREVIFDRNILNQGDVVKSDYNTYVSNVLKTAKFFATLSLTLSFPHELKGHLVNLIEDDSFDKIEEKLFDEYADNIFHYSQMQNLANFSSANSESKTFKFIENKYTHSLWMTNEQCQVVKRNFVGYQGHFDTSYCAVRMLVKFFEKLKDLDIYRKTKIIIVSDHGYAGHSNKKIKGLNVPHPRASALLLVKDFGQTGDLKISMKFMSNMDAYGIALSGVSGGLEIEEDKIKTPVNGRSLLHVSETVPANSYNISKAFRVKENMFNEENWEELNLFQIKQLQEQTLELHPDN